MNLKKMIERKASVVDQNVSGIKYLMDKNKITVFEGIGSFQDATHIKVTNGKTRSDRSQKILSSLPF
jgi:dihydrolipoamide dehydrogenase